jgi:hypothetical protein
MLSGLLGGYAWASTYVAFIPLDSPIYVELDTLNGLGLLDTYLNEILPISRVEAARLTLEAQRQLENAEQPDPLAAGLIQTLREQLAQEVEWLETDSEDDLPTMIRPLERAQAQFIYSRGDQRLWRTSEAVPGEEGLNATEGTPLLPNNDGIPTASGSNEVFRLAGWGGVGGFLTGYGEGAVTGPFTREVNIDHGDRIRQLGTAVVASLGNYAISFGTEEMWWGAGHFAPLMFSNNASPFPAVRIQNIHPKLLPWFFRYLGQFRYQVFFGQLDDDRYFKHPWIDGQIFSFKPLPTFEIGFTHAILFGGSHNNNYDAEGFLGRATGFRTGNPSEGNTHSRGGAYVKFYFPSLRGLQVYQEVVGNDNLSNTGAIGHFLPFRSVSYEGGIYLPRLTADGLTDFRFECAVLSSNDQDHSDSLYWAYNGNVMGNYMGPNASEVTLALGRWIALRNRVELDLYFSDRAPISYYDNPYSESIYGKDLTKEYAEGFGFNLLRLDGPIHGNGLLAGLQAQVAAEYDQAFNYQPHNDTFRLMLSFTAALSSDFKLEWR